MDILTADDEGRKAVKARLIEDKWRPNEAARAARSVVADAKRELSRSEAETVDVFLVSPAGSKHANQRFTFRRPE